jgi:hypothetical protein
MHSIIIDILQGNAVVNSDQLKDCWFGLLRSHSATLCNEGITTQDLGEKCLCCTGLLRVNQCSRRTPSCLNNRTFDIAFGLWPAIDGQKAKMAGHAITHLHTKMPLIFRAKQVSLL